MRALTPEEEALRRFRECYPDLVGDERLMALVDAEVARLKGEEVSFNDALPMAAETVRALILRWARAVRRRMRSGDGRKA